MSTRGPGRRGSREVQRALGGDVDRALVGVHVDEMLQPGAANRREARWRGQAARLAHARHSRVRTRVRYAAAAAVTRARSAVSACRKTSEKVGNGWITSLHDRERHARADRDGRLLEPLAGLRADRVGAGEPLAVGDERHEARARRRTRACRSRCAAPRRAGRSRVSAPVGLADRGRLRVGEHHARHGVVVGLARSRRGCSRRRRGPGTCRRR